ncbi:MAG: Do family serine endopeptidase [Deltaproteobacteria bacterium]|nr:Do family serine endopeptidase [Nannocystaceae bacterium]
MKPRIHARASLLSLALAAACAHAPATDHGPVTRLERVVADRSPSVGVTELERAFERSAEVIGPSVVAIHSERATENAEVPAFLRPFGPPDGKVRGLGSGVIIDTRGYILTNNHVVDGADSLKVRLWDERELDATVVGTDPKTDLAVVRIQADGLVAALTADSEQVRVGQWVIAAGSPFGLSKTVTAGIVSAVGRGGMDITEYGDFIQTDAAINQGNSGGPLIDLQGRVVGINTAIFSQTGGSNGIGFAIPIDLAKVVLAQLIDHGSVERGWIGIVMAKLTPELATSFGYRGSEGVLVDDIDPKGPGAKAGLRPGDIITALDGRSLRDMVALRNGVAQRRPGTKVKLAVFRDGKLERLDLQLGSLADPSEGKSKPAKRKPSKPATPAGLGLQLVDPSDEVRDRLRADVRKGAVVIGVSPGSVATNEIEPGDVIVEVAGESVRSASHAEKLLAKADLDKGVRVRVQRGPFGHYRLLRRGS